MTGSYVGRHHRPSSPALSSKTLGTGLAVVALSATSLVAATAPAHAYSLGGAIGAYYSTPAVRGELGAPQSDETCGLPYGGCAQDFQNGRIYWSPATGTSHLPTGAISGLYEQQKWSGSAFGYPVTAEQNLPNRLTGRFAKTLNPGTGAWHWIVWSGKTGAVPVNTSWAIGEQWEHRSMPTAGLPVSPEVSFSSGIAKQQFQNADILWSPWAGTHTLSNGFLHAYYHQYGGPDGSLGAPASEETRNSAGQAIQYFRNRATGRTSVMTWVRGQAVVSQDFTSEANRLNLGRATSGALKVFNNPQDSRMYQRFERGVVVDGSENGMVGMENHVFSHWQANAGPLGMPRSASWQSGKLVTTFDTRPLAYFPERGGLVMRTDVALGKKDALVVGDSQLAEGDPRDWVVSALRQDGYTAWTLAKGGIGFDRNTGNFGTYHSGVVRNHWDLPTGAPGIIYIQSSGNDRFSNQQWVRTLATETIQKLKAAYPNTKIIVAGVLSRKAGSPLDQSLDSEYWRYNNAARRDAVSATTQAVAREQGVVFVPLAGKITEWDVENLMGDHTHFIEGNDEGWASHQIVAAKYAPYLRGFLK